MARAYRARFWPLLASALVVYTPLSAVEALEESLGGIRSDHDVLPNAGILSVIALTTAVATIGDQLYSGLVEDVVSHWRERSPSPPLRQVVRRLPLGRLVVIDLIVSAATLCGLLLLIAPGMLAYTWFALAGPVATLEGRGVRAALRRSRELVRGSFWRVLLLLGAVSVATAALTDLLQAGLDAAIADHELLDWAAATIVTAPLAPLWALCAVTLTLELAELKGAGGALPAQRR